MATTVTETPRHTLTVTDSDFQLTVISGPQGPAGADSTVAGPQGPAGAAGPNTITSSTTSDNTGNIGLSSLTTSTLAAGSATISNSLTMSGNQSFGDGFKAEFGADDDLEIYHDGTQSRIINTTGELQIQSQVVDGDITFYADSGTGGSPAEYIRLDGSLVGTQFSKRILFPDNVKIQLGATQDLEIYHDGNNSFIDDAGSGDLNIRGANLNLQKYTGETFIACVADGSLSLYHDNAVKLATTTTGVTVTGTLNTSSLVTTLVTASAGSISDVTSTNVNSTNVKASADLGYSSGGTASQLTSITTGVTLNAPSGVITCQAHSFGNDDSQTFTLTNSHIEVNDLVLVSFQTGHEELYVTVSDVSAGSCNITLHASHSGSSITPNPFIAVLNFAVIKVATS
jgi:hypothetical protein